MKDSIIIKGCIYLWGLVFYGASHGEISKSLSDKFSGIFSMLYTAYSSSELLSTFTAVLITENMKIITFHGISYVSKYLE